jgi:Uma2 family endonuclease
MDHALLQGLTCAAFLNKRKEWDVVALVEQRVQVATARFRIPDIAVLKPGARRQPIVTVPPLIVIEVLSKDDSLRSMEERIEDYLNFGVENIWVLDPVLRRAYVCSRTGLQEPPDGVLSVSGTPIRIVLSDLFQQAEEML